MNKSFGYFDDVAREFVVTDPLTPAPWINYLGNTRLSAFISQQAGGLAWHIEPQQRRLTRYHWLPAPGDLDTAGLDVSAQTLTELLSVDAAAWRTEMAEVAEYLDSFDERTPADLKAELADVRSRLG